MRFIYKLNRVQHCSVSVSDTEWRNMRDFDGYKKGVNLGGWLSQCGNNYNKEHYDTFITEKDLETIKQWGLDHVRVPVDAEVI